MQKGMVKVLVDGKEVAGLGAYTYFGERSLLNDELTAADIVVERYNHKTTFWLFGLL
jgi:hypothetical protein